MSKSISKVVNGFVLAIIVLIVFYTIQFANAQDSKSKVKGGWRSLILATIKEDPQLLNSDYNKSSASSQVVAEYFKLFPNVILSGSGGSVASSAGGFSDFKKPSFTFPSTPRYTTSLINSYGYSGSARFDIVDKSFQILRIIRAQKLSTISRQQFNRVLSNVIKRGLYAYSSLYFANKKARLLNNRVRILQEKLKRINQSVKSRQRTLFDQWNAELSVQFGQESLLIAQRELKQAVAYFKRIFQRDISANTLTILSLPIINIPASSDESRLLVSSYNPQIIISRSQADIAGYDYGLKIQDTLPSVTAVASYSDYNNISATSPGKLSTLSFKLEVAIDVGLLPATITEAIAQQYKSLASSRNSIDNQRDILYNFNQAWESYQGSKKQVALLQAAVANNEKIVKGQRKLRKRGAVDILSVMEIESGFSLILERQLNAQREHQINTIDLLEMLNLLTPRSLNLK